MKILMRESGLTQKALAELLGVSLDRVKSLTSGRVQKLTREESEALVKKLHIRAEWLVTGEGPMFQSAPEQEFQRRLDVVAKASRQSAAAYLQPDQTDLLQQIMMAAEVGDSVTLRRLLRPLSERAAALLDDYERMSEDDRRALERTAAGLAAAGVAAAPEMPKTAVVLETEYKGKRKGPQILGTEYTGKRTGPTVVGPEAKAAPKKKRKDEAS